MEILFLLNYFLSSNQDIITQFFCEITETCSDSTCAMVSEILESVLQTVQKRFTYRQYILTDLYRRQHAEYTHIYSVHTVYY